MKKILLGLAFAILFACGPVGDNAESGLVITAPDGFAINCATNFTRVVPHLCQAVGSTESWNIGAAGCNTHALTTVPASAIKIYAQLNWSITSNNTVTLKQVNPSFYNDGTCATPVLSFQAQSREYVAVVAGTVIDSRSITAVIPIVTGTQNVVTNTTFTNVGAGTVFSIFVLGYYD